MTMNFWKKSLPEDADPSASYHQNAKANNANQKPSTPSLKASNISDPSDDIEPPIDAFTRANTVKEAEEIKIGFRQSLTQSLIQAHDKRDCVAPFRLEEIELGPKLGSGEFSNVYLVNSFKLEPNFAEGDASRSVEELDKRRFMKDNEKYRGTGKSRYALKHIKNEYHQINGSNAYIQAAGDLALESEFLASLQHPNIIKLRGITHLGAAGFAEGPSGYFLIIDRLSETLENKISQWNDLQKTPSRRFRVSMPKIPKLRKAKSLPQSMSMEIDDEAMDERFNIGLQISAALVYLHSHSIVFRDLKPANVGFDVRGDVKIFDFGLARTIPEHGNPNTDLYEMSGAGSPRYMAPECLIGLDYNLKADVYTFSIVLWEILTAKTPFDNARNMDDLLYNVIDKKERPVINNGWPSRVQGMLESSFDCEIEKRPTMKLWFDIIRHSLGSLRGGDMRGLGNTHINRRRTTESMRNLMKNFKR